MRCRRRAARRAVRRDGVPAMPARCDRTADVHCAPPAGDDRPMHTARLGPYDGVSRLTLGGGGLGQVWGQSSEPEAVASVHAAIDAGINVVDTAPMYLSCE